MTIDDLVNESGTQVDPQARETLLAFMSLLWNTQRIHESVQQAMAEERTLANVELYRPWVAKIRRDAGAIVAACDRLSEAGKR